jgi:hypothetical protein
MHRAIEAAEAQMLEGYRDGFADDREALPAGTNHPIAYVHGWLNGRDDRLSNPRLPAAEIMAQAAAILSLKQMVEG